MSKSRILISTMLAAAAASVTLAQSGALVFSKGGDAWAMNTDGSNQTRLTTTGGVSIVRLSNNVLVHLAGGQLYRSTLQGFALASSPQAIPNTSGVVEFDLSPDGSRIVLTYFAGSNTTLYTMSADGTNLTAIHASGSHQSGMSWGRDGYIYFVQSAIGNALSQQLYRIPENGGASPAQLTGYFSQFPAAGSSSGRIAFAYDYPVKHLRTMSADGSTPQDVPSLSIGDGGYISVDFFSDFIYYPQGDQIWRVRSDGSGNQLLASGALSFVDYGTLTVDDTPPVTTTVTLNPNPVPVGWGTTLSAGFTDAGGSGLAVAQYSIDGGAPLALGAISGNAATASTPISGYSSTGIHAFCARAQDMAGNIGAYQCALLAVYDPAAGFVTGGGWIQTSNGKSNFALSSRYQSNASTPSGEFELRSGGNRLKSTSLFWLVVSGSSATIQGNCSWNGVAGYLFEVTATDSSSGDTLSIRVWNGSGEVLSTGVVPLGGGQVVIH